jgi:hypothetical protein
LREERLKHLRRLEPVHCGNHTFTLEANIESMLRSALVLYRFVPCQHIEQQRSEPGVLENFGDGAVQRLKRRCHDQIPEG